MAAKSLLNQLIDGLRCLPGVGPKSAQRMAFHILQRDRAGGARLAAVLSEAVHSIGHCRQCRTLTEDDVCELCRNPGRDDSLLCVVENPSDVIEARPLHCTMVKIAIRFASPAIEGGNC